MKESYSDFSIIKSHLELRQKYDSEIKNFKESMREKEEHSAERIATLEQDVLKRNEYIKAQEKKIPQHMVDKLLNTFIGWRERERVCVCTHSI